MSIIQIAPRLYVSGYRAAKYCNNFYRICVSDSKREAQYADSHYPIDEYKLPNTFIKYARHVAHEAIQKLEEGRKVLIYCHAGKNRSVSCCLYLLAKYSDLNLNQALRRIRRIHPDEGIMNEIMDFLEYRFHPKKIQKQNMKAKKTKSVNPQTPKPHTIVNAQNINLKPQNDGSRLRQMIPYLAPGKQADKKHNEKIENIKNLENTKTPIDTKIPIDIKTPENRNFITNLNRKINDGKPKRKKVRYVLDSTSPTLDQSNSIAKNNTLSDNNFNKNTLFSKLNGGNKCFKPPLINNLIPKQKYVSRQEKNVQIY